MRAKGWSKIVDSIPSLYARVRWGRRVCTSHRCNWPKGQTHLMSLRVTTGPADTGSGGVNYSKRPVTGGYSEPAVREPTEPPDTATNLAVMDHLIRQRAKARDGS